MKGIGIGNKVRGVVALVATIVGLFAMAMPAHADANGDAEAQFVAKINQLRASKGLQQVVVDAQLTGIARTWAQHMADQGGISHNPNLASQVTEDWGKLGENVGMGPDVDSLMKAFIASPHHYENLVDPSFNRIGVGVVIVNGTMYTTHDFMYLRSSAPAPAPAAKPAPAPAPAPAPKPAPTVRRPASTPLAPVAAPHVAAPKPVAPLAAVAPIAPVAAPAVADTPAPARLISVLAQLHSLDAAQ